MLKRSFYSWICSLSTFYSCFPLPDLQLLLPFTTLHVWILAFKSHGPLSLPVRCTGLSKCRLSRQLHKVYEAHSSFPPIFSLLKASPLSQTPRPLYLRITCDSSLSHLIPPVLSSGRVLDFCHIYLLLILSIATAQVLLSTFRVNCISPFNSSCYITILLSLVFLRSLARMTNDHVILTMSFFSNYTPLYLCIL